MSDFWKDVIFGTILFIVITGASILVAIPAGNAFMDMVILTGQTK